MHARTIDDQLDAVLEGPPPPPPMDWHELASQTPPRRHWFEEHWLSPDPTYLGGRGGVGKTLLTQQMATCWASGRGFLESVSGPLTVLMWACEDHHDELWRRQHDICRWLGIDMAGLSGRLWIVPRRGHDNTLFAPEFGRTAWTRHYQHLRDQVNDLKADVFILDNIGQTFGGKSENDRHDVTAFVNGMAGLRLDAPFAPILLGHPAKAEGSEFSGSTAWENAVRTRWYLGATLPDVKAADDLEPDPSIRYLARRKANYSAQDWRRLRYTDGVLVPETTTDGSRYDTTARAEVARAVVRKGLLRLMDLNIDTVPGSTSKSYLPAKLVEMGFHEGHAKPELAAALNRLIADKVIAIVDVRGSDRNTRKVLRFADDL
jgi:RecA-family ATPase